MPIHYQTHYPLTHPPLQRTTVQPPEPSTPPTLDLSKLQKLRPRGANFIARCPACALEDGDRKSEHLTIFASGKFSCAIVNKSFTDEISTKRHNQIILQLAGSNQPASPSLITKQSQRYLQELDTIRTINATLGRELWDFIQTHWPTPLSWLQNHSAPLPQTPQDHFLQFCKLYQPNEFTWIGGRYDWHANHGNYCIFEPSSPDDQTRAWNAIQNGADHATAFLFPKDSPSRKIEHSIGRKFLILEHDDATLDQQLGLIRFANQILNLPLHHCTFTGNKGVHGIFKPTPSKLHHQIYYKILTNMGADPVFQSGNTRVPGAIRQKTPTHPGGRLQELLYVAQNPLPPLDDMLLFETLKRLKPLIQSTHNQILMEQPFHT